jgi:hypothetical protein
MATFSEVKQWLLKFSNANLFKYDQLSFEQKKSVLKEFANYVTKDFRTFKIAMVAIESMKGVRANFVLLARMHETIGKGWYFHHEKYRELCQKTEKKHLVIMGHRVLSGNE